MWRMTTFNEKPSVSLCVYTEMYENGRKYHRQKYKAVFIHSGINSAFIESLLCGRLGGQRWNIKMKRGCLPSRNLGSGWRGDSIITRISVTQEIVKPRASARSGTARGRSDWVRGGDGTIFLNAEQKEQKQRRLWMWKVNMLYMFCLNFNHSSFGVRKMNHRVGEGTSDSSLGCSHFPGTSWRARRNTDSPRTTPRRLALPTR